jgi:hypothetical protein
MQTVFSPLALAKRTVRVVAADRLDALDGAALSAPVP